MRLSSLIAVLVGALSLAACDAPVIVFPQPKECSASRPCASGSTCVEGKCVASTDGGSSCTSAEECPAPAHAAAVCSNGRCGRGPCEDGFFDFDATKPGCEASCIGRSCTLGDGTTTTLASPPVHERGHWGAPVSGGSHGGQVQTSATHTNVGHLGEPTPNAGVVEQTGGAYRNIGGFNAVLRTR